MIPYNRRIGLLLLLIVSVIGLAAPPAARAGDDWKEWKPVIPAELAMKTPAVDKNADAEVLVWDVRLDDSTEDLIFYNYIRIKIFTERGKETQSKIDIEYVGGDKVTDIAGRTIKPDGSIVELKKEAIFERTIAKVGRAKRQAKSFAMPAVEPGAIIEYRYREVWPYQVANYLRLHCQQPIPVHRVTYHLKPSRVFAGGAGMLARTFQGPDVPFVKEKDGFYSVTMTNMPAYLEEPRMPPEDQVRTWILIYYSSDTPGPPDKYWPRIGKLVHDREKDAMKVGDEVRRAAAEAMGDASTPDQKLERLFDFCRSKIKNVNDDASGMTASEREKLKRNSNPGDTLKRGMGTGNDINHLFAALATAAGFEA
ncbi:MAG TPA: DUF3857 domain-containing protein [Blastocatellia bacterium]|nr:DUF3857 domain-containing protein [Blastocatellia bacterium]